MNAPALPPRGPVKATREDWLDAARRVLIEDGAGEVKIARIGQTLDVSRSSFYWYFRDLDDLLKALLDEWAARNTAMIRDHCALPADTVTGAVCNFFRCFIDPARFDHGLDFAVRDWARRDAAVRARIEAADNTRLSAITAMFARYGFAAPEADIRARILYFMQLGYAALDQREPLEDRISRIEGFLAGFTGHIPTTAEVSDLKSFSCRTLAADD